MGLIPESRKIPWRRKWQPTPAFLPVKSHGQRSRVGCSPGGHEESDMTERLSFHFSLSCIGEENGNPLQCSCLESPRDGGSLVGCRLWGRTESDTTEATQQLQQQQTGKVCDFTKTTHTFLHRAWKIPWMEETSRLQSMRSLRVGHD